MESIHLKQMKLTCVKDKDELADFFEDNPHKGMPYGFPALKKRI